MMAGKHKNLWHLVEGRLASHPDETAFIQDGSKVSRADFADLCARTTAWLRVQGVAEGDTVAIWLVNRIEWLALFFATIRLGAVLVPINTRYRADEVTHILEKSGAKMLLLQPGFRKIDFASVLESVDGTVLPNLDTIVVLDAGTGTPAPLLGRNTIPFDLAGQAAVGSPDSSDPEKACIVFSTSGTTRGPKLVMHPQSTLFDHAYHCAGSYGIKNDSVVFAMLPFCGVFGLNGALAGLAGTAPVVMVDTFDAVPAARLIQQHGVTHTFGSDEMVRRLMDADDAPQPYPSLQFFGYGAFTSDFTQEAMVAWERGIPLYGLYGSSEVLALFSAQQSHLPVEECIKGGGMPAAGALASVRVRDVETGAVLPPGESGEIEIRSPSNFLGYMNDPDATAEVVDAEGYFITGDVGYLREDGSFVYKTRKGDAVRLAGFLVNPQEIEGFLKDLDGVADAQVVAVDIDGTARAVAFVIEQSGYDLSETDLIQQAREHIAPFKVPARVWFVDEYPVTLSSNGLKTQRNKLRDMARERLVNS